MILTRVLVVAVVVVVVVLVIAMEIVQCQSEQQVG
jgi:hypothetical protein